MTLPEKSPGRTCELAYIFIFSALKDGSIFTDTHIFMTIGASGHKDYIDFSFP